jgi:hypothetical protein
MGDTSARWLGGIRWLCLALPMVGCMPAWQSTEARLGRLDRALGGAAVGGSKYLRYTMTSDAGVWKREIVVSPGAYAEQRTRSDGARYAFGHDQVGGWVRVGEGAPIEAGTSMWDQEARTGAGLFGLRFTAPGADDEAAYMGKTRLAWELAYRPAGGRTVTFAIDHASSEPTAYDVVDDFGRLVSCDDLAFAHGEAGPVLAAWRCATNDRFGFAGKMFQERVQLDAEQAVELEGAPDWARPGARRRSPPPLLQPATVPITNPRRIEVPVRFGDRPPVNLILDTGAFFTILSRRAAADLGVVPTGEVRLHVDPPWLSRSDLWVGVVDKMSVAGAELYGERVLVATGQEFGDAVGLLGRSTLQRFIVDVDSPAGQVRFWARARFPRSKRLIRLHGEDIPMIDGEVVGVAKGRIMLDTGAENDIIVHARAMSVVHKREAGSDAFLGGPDSRHSPDYWSHIDGLRLGPFALPTMDAIGRDKDRELVGGGIALAGMGVMRYFRFAFDLRDNLLHAWPGDAYRALRRVGIDIEEGGDGPTVDRVIDRSPAAEAGMKRGDVILAVNQDYGAIKSISAARKAFARTEGGQIPVWVIRRGSPQKLEVVLPALPR